MSVPRKGDLLLCRAILELVVLIIGFIVSFLLLMFAIDTLGGEMSDEIGGTIAMLASLPAVALACLVGRHSWGDILGHRPHYIGRALAVSLPVGALAVAAAALLREWEWQGASLFYLAMIPVMAWAEELLFRGWFPQFLGGKLYAYLLPVPIFAAFHAPSSPLGWIGYFVSGTCFALLAWRVRGLGMSTVLHAVSNLTLNLVIAGTGYATWLIIPKSLLLVAVTAALLLWVPRRLIDAPRAEEQIRVREKAESRI